jgi:hypothetical protein
VLTPTVAPEQIRVTKLNHYEDQYEHRISEIRQKELRLLRSELAVWAGTMVFIVMSPVVATGATFATYVLVDESNVLSASKAFASSLLFLSLRFPINYFGRLTGKVAQAISSLERVSLFLNREARTSGFTYDQSCTSMEGRAEDGTKPSFSVQKASFSIGGMDGETDSVAQSDDAESLGSSHHRRKVFTASEFNVSVKKGEVLVRLPCPAAFLRAVVLSYKFPSLLKRLGCVWARWQREVYLHNGGVGGSTSVARDHSRYPRSSDIRSSDAIYSERYTSRQHLVRFCI